MRTTLTRRLLIPVAITGDITGTPGRPGKVGVGYAKFSGCPVTISMGRENSVGARFPWNETRTIAAGGGWFGPVWDSWLDNKPIRPYVWVAGAANPIYGAPVTASSC
ncbi:hypothetical protein [Amycolatopsis speibonae]|uniref:Uncharacterized protein n=1 Tax=Amycolatopsis speibonae TaxID=1450224 RepID=A0ABV7NRA9_9PSEU